ncbi:hypothetical protein HK096_005442, partial [Nowakowskiella sp. JEL0078]
LCVYAFRVIFVGCASLTFSPLGSTGLLIHGRCVIRNIHPSNQSVSFKGLEVAFIGDVVVKTPKSVHRTPLVSERSLLLDSDRDGEFTVISPGQERYSIPFQFIIDQEIADALPPSLEPHLGVNGYSAEISYRIIARCWGIDNSKTEGEATRSLIIERHHRPSLNLLKEYKTRNLEADGDSNALRYRIRAPKVIIPGSLFEVVYRFEKTRVKKGGKEDKLKRIEMMLTEKIWFSCGPEGEKSVELKFPMTVDKERCQKTGWDAAARFAFRLPPWSATREEYRGPLYVEKTKKTDFDKLAFMNSMNPSGDWGPIRVGHSILISVQYKQAGRKQHVFPVTILGATRTGLLEDPDWRNILETQDKMDEQGVQELNGAMSDEDALNLAMLESFLDPMTQPITNIDEEKALSNALDQSALMAIFSNNGKENSVALGDLLNSRIKTTTQSKTVNPGIESDLVNAGFTDEEAMFISIHASKFEQKNGTIEQDPFNESEINSNLGPKLTQTSEKSDKGSFEFDFGAFEKPKFSQNSTPQSMSPIASIKPTLTGMSTSSSLSNLSSIRSVPTMISSSKYSAPPSTISSDLFSLALSDSETTSAFQNSPFSSIPAVQTSLSSNFGHILLPPETMKHNPFGASVKTQPVTNDLFKTSMESPVMQHNPFGTNMPTNSNQQNVQQTIFAKPSASTQLNTSNSTSNPFLRGIPSTTSNPFMDPFAD